MSAEVGELGRDLRASGMLVAKTNEGSDYFLHSVLPLEEDVTVHLELICAFGMCSPYAASPVVLRCVTAWKKSTSSTPPATRRVGRSRCPSPVGERNQLQTGIRVEDGRELRRASTSASPSSLPASVPAAPWSAARRRRHRSSASRSPPPDAPGPFVRLPSAYWRWRVRRRSPSFIGVITSSSETAMVTVL